MDTKIFFYYRDEKTAEVTLGESKVYIKRFVIHPAKQLFSSDEISRYEYGKILESRCWDRNRENIDKYLNKLGLSEFDPYEIVKRTHGVMFQDYIWCRTEDEDLTFDDVRVR